MLALAAIAVNVRFAHIKHTRWQIGFASRFAVVYLGTKSNFAAYAPRHKVSEARCANRTFIATCPVVNEPAAPGQATLDAAAAILEPLAGLLLSHQIRFAQAEELLKAAFVQASARAYAAQGKLPSVSTLSVATGIRRREVKRLVEATGSPGDALAARHMSPAVQARLRWTTDPQFLDARGRPLRLARNPTPGEPSFADLAATVSKDTHPKALLDELVRIGAAEDDGESVALRHRFLAPSRDREAKLEVGGTNVSDHLWAVLLNLLSESPPLMERAVFADGLTEASAREGAALARDLWSNALTALREKLQALVDRDECAPDNNWRMRIGIYGYFAPMQRPLAPVNARARRTAGTNKSGAPRRAKR
jgi:Family of unknown function (DUF6502)